MPFPSLSMREDNCSPTDKNINMTGAVSVGWKNGFILKLLDF